ncbi:MAG: hypothetical protein M3O03_13305 [Pseudomonadota bacterium]|nr:hypothetical protein [Pseudomonadota bacterium]
MRFNMPHHPLDFEIPDAWWEEAGMNNFQRTGSHYRTQELGDKLKLIPLTPLEPPTRLNTHAKDWRGFDKARLISVLSGFVGNHQIEPVEVTSLGDAIYQILTPIVDTIMPLRTGIIDITRQSQLGTIVYL